MKFHGRAYKVILCVVAALLLCGAGAMERLLNNDRAEMGFARLQPLQNAPPVLAFTTVALGGFRGLIANALWIRASELQDENKYFEMVQLADWITKLQPHMVQVWLVQAWNMAYNVSVKFKNPEDRWLWVQRGISLLRDDGLTYNPGQTLMYRELSWIYQHKVGANLDDAHMTYKLHLAQQMEPIFPDGKAHTNELIHPPDAVWKERARKLRETYKMDPQVIARVDSMYGPLDWRLPDAHAIYWAELGRIDANKTDEETLRRSIFQSMRLACFIGGGLAPGITNVTKDNFFLRPNLELIPTINSAYEKMVAEETNASQKLSFETANKNFLKEAIPLLYVDGEEQKAAYWFKYLKDTFTNQVIFPPNQANFTLDQYVLATLTEDTGETDQNKVAGALIGLIHREYICYLFDENDKVANTDALLRKIYDHYELATEGIKDRIPIPKLAIMRQFVLSQMLDPESDSIYRLSEYNRNLLRSRLGLPANFVPSATLSDTSAYSLDTISVPNTNTAPSPQAANK